MYTLSRGKGVPDATRATFKDIRDLLEIEQTEKHVVHLDATRIGIEGETRLCAEFADAKTARATTERIRALARDVELMNVVAEPCGKR